MKTDYAEALLAKVMNWSEEDVAKQRTFIEIMAEYKYDDYQQFAWGQKYIDSLALWLKNFDPEDRTLLYNFIKKELVFVSSAEMYQLVEAAYPQVIFPALLANLRETCTQHNITSSEERHKAQRGIERNSLFLGLSDGAHTDIFRRSNVHLSHEQIHVYYDFSDNKAQSFVEERDKDLDKMNLRPELRCREMMNIFLLDDFAGSGISFIRYNTEKEEWGGKICKFLDLLNRHELVGERTGIYIVLYLATEEAVNRIQEKVDEYKEYAGIKGKLRCLPIQIVPKMDPISDDMTRVLEKYYARYKLDRYIIDGHFEQGKTDKPYLGFNECSLPLVLFHNTPNNSFPIIWFDNEKFRGLFPRVTRHKGD